MKRFFAWLIGFFKKKEVKVIFFPAPSAPIEIKKPIPSEPSAPPSDPVKPERQDETFADISHYEKINFSQYEKKILITKATEGTDYTDATFMNNKVQCKFLNIKFGAYHFFRGNSSAAEQALHFLNICKDFDMPPILDCEDLNGTPINEYVKKIKTWLDMVEAKSGMVPIIYGSYSFLKELKLDESFARYPLWLAHYTTINKIKCPAPWKKIWAWQFSDKENFKGIGHCDGNILFMDKSNGF